jgi:DNA-binding response OmpR family regulator
MAKHILLVDDDALLRRSLTFSLEQAGYEVSAADSAEAALLLAQRRSPDLVLLDIALPGMDGIEALRRLQQRLATPVVFLTARRRELDEVLGLELGADDYITKPVETDILLARVKAVLRRTGRAPVETAHPSQVVAGDLRIDPAAHTVSVGERCIDLSPREFELLYLLASQAGKVAPGEELIAQVWGPEFSGEPQVLYVHIRWLREKIEDDPNHPRRILTVRGVGYKFVTQESHVK